MSTLVPQLTVEEAHALLRDIKRYREAHDVSNYESPVFQRCASELMKVVGPALVETEVLAVNTVAEVPCRALALAQVSPDHQHNPGALVVIGSGVKEHGLTFLELLETSALRGSAIWCAYKDDCGENLEDFYIALRGGAYGRTGEVQR